MENILLLFCTVLLLSVMFFMSVGVAQAQCIQGVPIWGTDDTKETCRYKKLQDAEEKRIELEARDIELQRKKYDMQNGTGVRGNNNVILGGLPGFLGGGNTMQNAKESGFIVQTTYQVRVESLLGVKPDSKHFNSIRPPDGAPLAAFGVAFEYFISPNMSFGIIGQQYTVSGAKDFDPIKDTSGDILFFPGEVEKAEYRLILPYVAFNGLLGGQWHWTFRLGAGQNKVELKRNPIDASLAPKAVQPEDQTHSDSAAIMFDLGVEKWVSGFKYGCAARYITSGVDTRNVLEHMNMGSQQFLCYVQFMIRPLGLI